MSFNCCGLRIGIRATRPGFLGMIENRLPPGLKPTRTPVVDRMYSVVIGGPASRRGLHRMNLLYVNATRLVRECELEPVVESLEVDLRRSIAHWAPRLVFIHAGVVGWRGRAIVIPGHSMSGKSTLVAALVRAGATYYSDEYAVLDHRGRVFPFAKPLSVREPGSYKSTDHPVEQFGGHAGREPLPVALVIVTRYAEGARWRPRRLRPSEAALALLRHGVAARRDPARVMKALRHCVADAEALRGARGEATEMAQKILSL